MIRVIVDGLAKRFDRVAAVDGASLEIRPGELLVVTGPSGSGKTTLARLIAGLDRPDHGDLYFDGRVMQTVPAAERKVGMVFQDDALWPHLSVADNVGYGLRLRRISGRERRLRVAEAMDLARIGSLGNRRPDQLSPLQRRRAALARALVVEPNLLILDEPLGPLEARARVEFREELRPIHAEAAVTTLLLTQDPREALALADRLGVMDLGRIVQAGPPTEVYNRPADAFVAQFLGPANLLSGQVEATDSRGETIVRTPIGRLVGHTPNGPLAGGTLVTVAIRPEALVLGHSSLADVNRFVATLERQVLLGEIRQVHLLGPGDHPVLAFALQSQSDRLRDGQSLTVSIPPERVMVLPERASAAD